MTRMTAQEDAELVRKLRLIETSQAQARAARRWKKRPRVTLSDVAVWTLFTLATAVVLLAVCVLLILVWPSPAEAKSWHRVITVSGGDEQYTDQYTRGIKLRGGAQKMTAIVTPDPELVELDLANCWFASWSLEKQGKWDWAYMTMDPAEGSGTVATVRFHLSKGHYHVTAISPNCTWTYTIWEKR